MAREFDGNDTLLFATPPTAIDGLATLTLSIWLIYDNPDDNYRDPIWKGGSYKTNSLWLIQHEAGRGNTNLSFLVPRSTADGRWNLNTVNKAWHNHVITYDFSSTSNDPIWYVDGTATALSEVSTPSGTVATDINELTIGSGFGGASEFWDGKIGEVAVWTRILKASEAASIGKGYSPLFVPRGLEFYASLIGKNSPEGDIVGGAMGTVTGATAFKHPRIIYPRNFR